MNNMELMLPPPVESTIPLQKQIVREANLPKSETYTIGKVDEYQDVMNQVRTMITMAIGTLKEVKAQVREKAGARFLIGEILSCLGHAQKVTSIKPSQLNFKRV